jgi:sterol 3beta-glucosyltransferase
VNPPPVTKIGCSIPGRFQQIRADFAREHWRRVRACARRPVAMRVGLQSWGTEGDLRPFLALGRALQRRGHEVDFVFTSIEGKDFSALAAEAGVATRFVGDDYFVTHRDVIARRARENLHVGPRHQFESILKDLMDPVADAMLGAARALAAECDVVAGHFLAHGAPAAAEEHDRPYVLLALQPVFASAHYPPAGTPALGRLLNPLLWKLANAVMGKSLLGRSNMSRARCGLKPKARFSPLDYGDPAAVLVAVSPALFPRPRDWEARLAVSGFLDLAAHEAPWTPEPRVARFLAEGAPVFCSFGSMLGHDDAQTMESIEAFAAALALAGVRGIIQAPAAIVARAPARADLCYVERAPHAQLFPQCATIVHHGGAGTMQSAVLSGRGSVVVPHAADQFYWADLLYARGVAARPLKRSALTPRRLAERIRAVLDDPGMAARAGVLANAIRAERGADQGAELIERAATRGRPRADGARA